MNPKMATREPAHPAGGALRFRDGFQGNLIVAAPPQTEPGRMRPSAFLGDPTENLPVMLDDEMLLARSSSDRPPSSWGATPANGI
jgi:hypothetical protein